MKKINSIKGNFVWKDKSVKNEVVFEPSENGKFMLAYDPILKNK